MYARVDIELTNRCNAKCTFCPRDQTPHQGLMTPEIFEQSLARTIEYRTLVEEILHTELSVALCGLGEPLLNKHAAAFTRRVKAEGFRCGMSSNAALLDERRGTELLDAGLDEIFINVGERDERYEEIYQLPFERTRDNVVRFAQQAEGRCDVWIVLVDYRHQPDHTAEMKRYWQDLGIKYFQEYEIINRGGALFVDHMQFEQLPELAEARAILADGGTQPLCGAPFGYLFVGYDGNYYLCCSDWRKEVPLGSVFERSFSDTVGDKLRHVVSRAPICRTCNLDPINRLTEELQAIGQGQSGPAEREALVAEMAEHSTMVIKALEKLQPGISSVIPETLATAPPVPEGRTLIPLTIR